ncbi:hypothetical protein LSCM1_08183 [Leishmania martiniquensis]|uniref:Uncharacterized protein n=1 Tax=Leishmania martiniquensis TaxID=1580590 RepID=A0A836HUZ5_9TRYP|nr:hypothetical protein LSCM1_08183 [Leishmania martiniquensis]
METTAITTTTKPYNPSASIYDAWEETLLPFLVPAVVLSSWPVLMLFRERNRTPLKLLAIAALVSLADGLLGSCAFPLQHQYAFSPTANSALFYAGTVTYWLSGAALSPLMELMGCRRSCMVLAIVGAAGAWGSGQCVVFLTLVGRIASAAATSGLSTWVECALYHEGRVHRIPATAAAAADSNRGEELGGGGTLTLFHQLRPLMLLFSMVASQYVMVVTPTVSLAPCWAAFLCYIGVFVAAWSLAALPGATVSGSTWSMTAAPLSVNGSGNGAPSKRGSAEDALWNGSGLEGATAVLLPGVALKCGGVGGSRMPAPQRILRHYMHAYSTSIRTLCLPRYVARHIVDIVFGAAFITASLLWVPTLELYDDSVPFGFVFKLFMIATLLGSTFSLPVWAVGGAEAALVALLSLSERTLSTSRDYAIPVTIMLSGIVLHLTYGCVLTTGSLWRAEYPAASAPLTLLSMMKAFTGILGWVFLNAIDGKYVEDAFVFEAQWVWLLMWVEAVALTQYIVARMAPVDDFDANGAVTACGMAAELRKRDDSGTSKDPSGRLASGAAAAAAGGTTVYVPLDTHAHPPHDDAESPKA